LIPKRVIERFLRAHRDDHRWLKHCSHRELDELLCKLDPRICPHPKLGLHQKVGLYLGIKYKSFAFWVDMGCGKTLLSLEIFQYLWDIGALRRALVFVTSDKAFPTWERQLREYKITVPYCTLDAGPSKEKWRILRHFGDGIIFLHYPGAVAMVAGKPSPRAKKKQLLLGKVDKLLENVDAVVYDESTKASRGNGNDFEGSLTYQLCWEVSRAARYRYALAGMPFGRDPTPLWAQMNLVDHGETLGETLGLFHAAFFRERKGYGGRPEFKFKSNMKESLAEIIQHNSMTYTADECIDLPPVRRIPVPIRLTQEIKEYYCEVIEEAIAAKGNKSVMKNAFLRMRQLSSGFIGLKDDETGEKAEIEFEKNPKLEWTLDFLDALPRNHKALIFYQFTVSGRRIAREIQEQFDIEPVWLWSGTKNAGKEIERFMKDPSSPFAVVNNQVGAYSLDGLQVANYEVFFESPLSVIDRSQAERRIIRQGQQFSKCFLYDPVVEDTVDEKILEFHAEGRDLFKALLTNPSRVLKRLRT
jgi:hypothetical protein